MLGVILRGNPDLEEEGAFRPLRGCAVVVGGLLLLGSGAPLGHFSESHQRRARRPTYKASDGHAVLSACPCGCPPHPTPDQAYREAWLNRAQEGADTS